MANAKKTSANRTKTARKTTAQTKAAAAGKKASKKAAGSTREGSGMTVSRRSGKDRRSTPDRRKNSEPVKVERRKIERRVKVNRRRQIDPTTCERDYSAEEIEFMSALEEYKRSSGRMFPTCSEILEVIRNLGYRKHPAEPSADPPPESPAPAAAAEPTTIAPGDDPPLSLVHESLVL